MQARILEVMCHELRLGFGNGREVLDEHPADPLVKLLSPCAQQILVGDVAQERVFEAVHFLTRPSTAIDESRVHQSLQNCRKLVTPIGTTAPKSSRENCCPMTAATCAMSLAGPRRSRRAISESCNV